MLIIWNIRLYVHTQRKPKNQHDNSANWTELLYTLHERVRKITTLLLKGEYIFILHVVNCSQKEKKNLQFFIQRRAINLGTSLDNKMSESLWSLLLLRSHTHFSFWHNPTHAWMPPVWKAGKTVIKKFLVRSFYNTIASVVWITLYAKSIGL